jgi:hypothetical protein
MTFLRRGPWKARSPWKGRGPWCAKGPFGVNDIAWTLDATAAAIREAIGNADAWGTTGATTGWRLPGLGSVRLSADAMTGPRLEQQQDGTYRWAAHNLLLNSATLSTQSVTVVVGEQYTIAATGTGSVALSGAATGTLNASSARPSLTVTATTTTLTCTVTGTVTAAQVNRGATALAYVPTAGAARYAPAVPWDAALGVWGLRSEPAATNSIRNSTMQGAASGVVGSGGAWPTNWSAGGDAGLTVTITTGVTLAGLPAIDVRWQGTPTGNAFVIPDVTVAAVSGQVWATSLIVARQAGSATNTAPKLALDEHASGGGWLAGNDSAFTPGVSATRPSHSRTLNNASTASVRPLLILGTTNGAAIDITLRIAAPQLERDRVTSPIPTFAATVTRTVDSPLVPGLPAMTEGVVVVEFVRTVASGAAEYAHPFSINDGVDYDDEIGAYIEPSTVAGVYLLVRTSGSTVVESAVSGGASGRNALAVGFKADDYAAAVNGGAVTTDTSGALAVRTSLSLGHRLSGGNSLSGGLITRIRLATRKPPNDRVRTLGIVS